ncbi:cupin (plasmid) [Rhizobium sp. CB3090]|uniref:cupin n=1 Tax=Rhizobium sp. CB3090 TaxID=3039156 RepID=UPI0024B067AB|nr:cupin [Rhizobium sp. CB3090]WFU11602.1 cupin [Rhizobium sp. CB3090]
MKIEKIYFQPSGWVPNNQRLPVLIYRGAPSTSEPFSDFGSIFAANGWTGIWENGVFDYQHYHSGAHEVLGVRRGSATLLIGGPEGQPTIVSIGDCLVLPAGTGHRNLGCSPHFTVVGAYPEGQHADIQTAAATPDMLAKIASLSVPDTDPIHGASGGLLDSWR